MKVSLLGAIITISGVIFFASNLAIIILGKKVGEGGQQKVKIGSYVDLSTNSVLLLILITAIYALTPTFLTYWNPRLDDYIHEDDLDKKYLPLEDLSLSIRGTVVLQGGEWAKDVNVRVIRTLGESETTVEEKTGQQGDFQIDLLNAKPKERYVLTLSKKGYSKKTLRFGFLEINSNYRLSKEGEGQ